VAEQLQAILAIVLIDLALSGDNALVIGMASRGLPRRQRRMAISIGAAGAVALRVLAAVVATILLTIPYLQLAGGIVLALIAYRLVRPDDGKRHQLSAARSLPEAIAIILVADAAMSTENILGVAAAAHGDVPLLVFGLALSIPIVLFGSSFVASLLERFPQIVWIGAAALAWTAADLILGDPAVPVIRADIRAEAVLAVVLLGGIAIARRVQQRQRA
jgi:YjbE family integral membrane protein